MTRKKKERSPLDITMFQSRAQQIEDSKNRIMRVNAYSTNVALHTAVLVPASSQGKFTKKAKKVAVPKRQRAPNEALPPFAHDLWKRPDYRTGDGDIPSFQRPGSDHSHLKSFGTLT